MTLGSGHRNTWDGGSFNEMGNSGRGVGGGWDVMSGILCMFIPSAFEVSKGNYRMGIK